MDNTGKVIEGNWYIDHPEGVPYEGYHRSLLESDGLPIGESRLIAKIHWNDNVVKCREDRIANSNFIEICRNNCGKVNSKHPEKVAGEIENALNIIKWIKKRGDEIIHGYNNNGLCPDKVNWHGLFNEADKKSRELLSRMEE